MNIEQKLELYDEKLISISNLLCDIKEVLEKYYHDKRFDKILNNLERTKHNIIHLSKKINEIDNRTLYKYPKLTSDELSVVENN